MVTEHNTTYRTYRWLVGPLVPYFRAKKAIGTRVNWLRWTSSLSGQVDRKTAQPKGRGWRGAELYAYANFLSRDDVKLGAPNSFAPSKKKIKKGGHEKSISFQFISIHFRIIFGLVFWWWLSPSLVLHFSQGFSTRSGVSRNTQRKSQDLGTARDAFQGVGEPCVEPILGDKRINAGFHDFSKKTWLIWGTPVISPKEA